MNQFPHRFFFCGPAGDKTDDGFAGGCFFPEAVNDTTFFQFFDHCIGQFHKLLVGGGVDIKLQACVPKALLLAKGHIAGIQFDTLFTGNLYCEIGAHAIRLAQILQQGLRDAGLELYINSPTNQQFVELPDTVIKKLEKRGVVYSFWEKTAPGKTVIRFVTSWATKEETVRELIQIIKETLIE